MSTLVTKLRLVYRAARNYVGFLPNEICFKCIFDGDSSVEEGCFTAARIFFNRIVSFQQ